MLSDAIPPSAATLRPGPSPVGPHAAGPRDETGLRAAALRLEAAFLSEMLGAAGIGAARGGPGGGGAGEEQFASFLRQAQADALVRRGGLGLAEAIFESLKEGADDVR